MLVRSTNSECVRRVYIRCSATDDSCCRIERGPGRKMTRYDLILYFTTIRVLKCSHNNHKYIWGKVFTLFNFQFILIRMQLTKPEFTVLFLIKTWLKFVWYNEKYYRSLYLIELCLYAFQTSFFFTIASTDTAIFVPEVNAPRDPWTDCFVHIGGRLFTFCKIVAFNKWYLA